MSNLEETGVLKYGDIIKLNCEDFYLTGKGLTHSSLFWGKNPSELDQCLSAFRVLPKSINLIQTQLLTSINSSTTKDLNVNMESLRLEIMNNMHHYSKAIGSIVTVGSNIELQHLATNKYLGVQLEISSSSSHEYLKFKLKENPDDTCLIRLEPVFNFQKERSKLMDGDKVYFEIWISKLNAPIYMLKTTENVFASFESKSKVKLELTCPEPEDEQSGIFSWNYVFIKDSENNMSLSITEGEEIAFTNEIELHKCLWRIEQDSPCGIVPKKSYKIRHITKKKYLNLDTRSYRSSSLFAKIVPSARKGNQLSVVLDNRQSSNSDWIIDPINQTEYKYIKSQYCTIYNEMMEFYLSMDYLQMERCYPSLEHEKNDNIFFLIFKCNEEISTDVAYADEIVSRLSEFSHFNRKNYEDSMEQDEERPIVIPLLKKIPKKHFFLDSSLQKNLKKCLKILEDFILNKNFNIASESGLVGEVSKSRQDILRNQGIFEVMFELLLNFQNSGEQNHLVQFVFSILVLLCRDNPKNKSFVLSRSDVLKGFVSWDPVISKNLISIIENFREGHQKFSSLIQLLIDEHIRIIQTEGTLHQLEYVDFLLKVSVCEGQGMTSNQDLIISKLLIDSKFFEFPQIEDGRFSLKLDTGEIVFLEELFYKENSQRSHPYEKVKFVKLMQVLIHLCDGRNYNCITKISQWFPFAVLVKYVYGNYIEDQLRALLLTLISKAYIDTAPRFIKDLPDFVVDYVLKSEPKKLMTSKVSPLISLKVEESLPILQIENTPLIKKSDHDLETLKGYLFNHFKIPDHSASNYKLAILKLINLMGRFNMFDTEENGETNDHANLVVTLAKLIKSDFLLENHSVVSNPISLNKEKKVETNFEFLRKQKARKTTVFRYSTKIFNCLSSNQKTEEDSSDLNEDCIVEILQAISYYLNWRQDAILKEIFLKISTFKEVSKFLESIPPVIKKEGTKTKFTIISTKLLVKLLDLVIRTKKLEVKSLALSIFIRSCYVLRETIFNINKIEFLKDPNDILVHKYLKKTKRTFIEIAEKSEIWVQDPRDSRYENFSTILKDFSTLLSVNSTLVEERAIGGSEEISVIRQNIFFNLKIHIILMRFINDTEYFVEQNKEIKSLLRMVYQILSKMIKDHKPHQDYFKKHLKLFLVDLKYDLGQIDTVCEIYNNHYELCSSVDVPFINLFISCILKYGRQARFLRIFEIIQIVDKEPILDIQLKVMNCLLDRQHYKTLCYCAGEEEVRFEFDRIFENDQPFIYHAQLFKVMSRSTTGIMDVEINESKCKKILTLSTLFVLLKHSEKDKNYSPMLIPLLELFYEVYLDSKQRLDKMAYFKELKDLVIRTRENLSKLSHQHISLIIKILKKYSDIYSLNEEIADELSEECKLLLFAVHKKGDLELIDNDLIDNLNNLSKTFNIDWYTEPNKETHTLFTEVLELNTLKIELKDNPDLKKLKKIERFNIADIIFDAKKEGYDMKSIIYELLQIIKFYKSRKISKKTVLLSILILKTLVINEKEGRDNKSISELEELNGLSLILQILSERDTEFIIFQKLLVLLIKILKKGTTETQNLFYNYFINNQESEVFFKSLSGILLRFKPSSREITENSFKPICRTLELAKLLCENHNTQLQNYLRLQDKSLISYNFIGSILNLLENLIKYKEKSAYKAAGLCLDTLTEMCQGPCKENQRAVIDSIFVEIVNELLGINEKSDDLKSFKTFQSSYTHGMRGELLKEWMIVNLKYKSLLTLHSLIEGNEDKYILSRMLRTINIETLYKNMLVAYESHFKPPPLEFPEKTFSLQVGILIYQLLRIFQDNPTKENKTMVKDLLPEISFDKGTFNYLDKEIYMTEESEDIQALPSLGAKKKTQVSPLNESGQSDEKNKKEIFNNAVKFYEERTGNIDVMLPGDILCKIYFWLDKEFLSLTEEMKYDFHYNADRSSDKNKLEYLLNRVDDIKDHIKHESYISKMITDYKIVNILSKIIYWKILAFMSAIILFGLTLEYYTSKDSINFTLSMLTAESHFYRAFHALEITHLICSILIVIFYYLKSVPVIFKKAARSENILIKNHLLFQFFYVYMNLETIYVSLYLVFSVLGCFFHVFFFAFHLLDFLYLFPSLQSVIISVIRPWKSICLLLCLIVIVMYILSLFSYIYFNSFFLGNCDGLLMCTFYSILEGIKNSGGVGYYTYYNKMYWGELRFSLFLYDNINNIILFIILWSILTGVIINAFAVIRGEKESNFRDQISKCFICGMMKDDIEEITKKPFKFHRRYEHNEWYYIFFIIYLQEKDSQEYSGIESIISKEIKKSSMNWVPQGKGFSLKKDEF